MHIQAEFALLPYFDLRRDQLKLLIAFLAGNPVGREVR